MMTEVMTSESALLELCITTEVSLWDLLDVEDYQTSSNLLLETQDSSALEENLNLPSLIQLPVCSDTALLNMFPVAEPSHLDNIDSSFLDEFCIQEDKQHTEVITMADYTPIKGNSFAETNSLAVDWLSGNVNIDFDVLEEQSFQQPAINHGLYSADVYNSIFSDSAGKIDFVSPLPESFLNESPCPEERIYLSCDESAEMQDVEQRAESPHISESGEIFEHNIEESRSRIAGEKYLHMRRKNNIASQRSRKLRKYKNSEMVEKLKELEVENKELLLKATELEKERDALQKQLMSILSKK